jgi:hypothetical protein
LTLADNLPLPPLQFRVKDKGSHHIALEWEAPSDASSDTTYNLYLKAQSEESFSVFEVSFQAV